MKITKSDITQIIKEEIQRLYDTIEKVLRKHLWWKRLGIRL
tara:strand:- start:538 stop:660 length:123 start_codon:yes stop_codon:yes gene_type:complete